MTSADRVRSAHACLDRFLHISEWWPILLLHRSLRQEWPPSEPPVL